MRLGLKTRLGNINSLLVKKSSSQRPELSSKVTQLREEYTNLF